ncbi:MAG: hypothetical protein AABX10_04335 [Nanoarchaeota archaeon]
MSRRHLDDEESLWRFVWGTRISDRAPFIYFALTLLAGTVAYFSGFCDHPERSDIKNQTEIKNSYQNNDYHLVSVEERRRR